MANDYVPLGEEENDYLALLPRKPTIEENDYMALLPPRLENSSAEAILSRIEADAGVKLDGPAREKALGDIAAHADRYDLAPLGGTDIHAGPTSRGGARHAHVAPPDYSAAFEPQPGDLGNLGEIGLRAAIGRVPDIIGNMLELPATVNDAVARQIGVQPGFLDVFRDLAASARGVSYTKDLDAAGVGLPSVTGHDLVEALNPRANANRAEDSGSDDYEPLTLGDRAATVAKFIPETLVASLPDMAATLDPATLAGYIGGRTNEVANNRAANAGHAGEPTLGDVAVAAPAAALESLLERFTTMRLLPHGTTLATPGVKEALLRLAKETGIQSTLGGVEEVVPYAAEQAGTNNPATAEGAFEQFLGGALSEGALGTVVQGAKEALHAASSKPNTPAAPASDSAPPDATARPSSPTAPAPVAGQSSNAALGDAVAKVIEQAGPDAVAGALADAVAAPQAAQPTTAAPESPRAPAPAQAATAPLPELAEGGESAPVAGVAPAGDGVSVSKDGLDHNLPPGARVGGAADIQELASRARTQPIAERESIRYAVVSPEEAHPLQQISGLDVTGYRHSVDGSALRHAMKQHGTGASELPRGQLPLADEDFAKIPQIVADPDSVTYEGKDKIGRDLLRYTKRFNGSIYYVEEVRTKRHELAAKTMWKAPSRAPLPAEASTAPTPEATGGYLPGSDDTPTGANSNETPQSRAPAGSTDLGNQSDLAGAPTNIAEPAAPSALSEGAATVTPPIEDQPASSGVETSKVQPAPAASSAPNEPAANEPNPPTTGINNNTVAQERALKGKDQVEFEGKREDADLWDAATEKLKADPVAGASLAASLAAHPRTISDEEVAVLIQDRVRIKNEHADAEAAISKAKADGDPVAEAAAHARLAIAEDALDLNDRAARAAGTQQGRSLRARRLLSRFDYTLADMVQRAKRALGKEPSEADRAELRRLSELIAEKDKQIAAFSAAKVARKSGLSGAARTNADAHFRELGAKLKAIREADQLIPGCKT